MIRMVYLLGLRCIMKIIENEFLDFSHLHQKNTIKDEKKLLSLCYLNLTDTRFYMMNEIGLIKNW